MECNGVQEVLEYLSSRKESERDFVYRHLNGDCYVLARTLTEDFGGEILMNEHRDHVIARICGKMFDANGLISAKHAREYHTMTDKERKAASTWRYRR